MILEPLESILRGESNGKKYLVKACWKDYVRFCIRCKSRRLYRVRRDRYRCGQCGYEFSDFAGRWINKVKLPPRDWLWLIKLFETGISARRACQQLGISYPTVHKAFDLIRQSITVHSGSAELLNGEGKEIYGENRLEERRAKHSNARIPVFGFFERKGYVRVEKLKNLSAEAVFQLSVEIGRRGSVVYTGRWESYDALIFCGYKHLPVDFGGRFSKRCGVHIDGVDGFWSYAKERLNKFHGISEQKFPFYLKELEFRYNHRHEPIFDTLVEYLCDFTAMEPKKDDSDSETIGPNIRLGNENRLNLESSTGVGE